MSIKSAKVINNYISKSLVGFCKDENSLYKLTDENKKIIDYSKVEITSMVSFFSNNSDEIDNCHDMELGSTILVGYKLHGQTLIDNIGNIIINVYNENKELIAKVPFTLYVDISSGSVALQEIAN